MKRFVLLASLACALAGNLKADIVERNGYFISSADVQQLDAKLDALQKGQPSNAIDPVPIVQEQPDFTPVLSIVLLVLGVIVGTTLYFLPSFIAARKRNSAAIFVLNLLTGWSFIGWVAALVWSCTTDPNEANRIHVSQLAQ